MEEPHTAVFERAKKCPFCKLDYYTKAPTYCRKNAIGGWQKKNAEDKGESRAHLLLVAGSLHHVLLSKALEFFRLCGEPRRVFLELGDAGIAGRSGIAAPLIHTQ